MLQLSCKCHFITTRSTTILYKSGRVFVILFPMFSMQNLQFSVQQVGGKSANSGACVKIRQQNSPQFFIYIYQTNVCSDLGMVSFNSQFNFTLEKILVKFLTPKNHPLGSLPITVRLSDSCQLGRLSAQATTIQFFIYISQTNNCSDLGMVSFYSKFNFMLEKIFVKFLAPQNYP